MLSSPFDNLMENGSISRVGLIGLIGLIEIIEWNWLEEYATVLTLLLSPPSFGGNSPAVTKPADSGKRSRIYTFDTESATNIQFC
jgi:hypothetical protein